MPWSYFFKPSANWSVINCPTVSVCLSIMSVCKQSVPISVDWTFPSAMCNYDSFILQFVLSNAVYGDIMNGKQHTYCVLHELEHSVNSSEFPISPLNTAPFGRQWFTICLTLHIMKHKRLIEEITWLINRKNKEKHNIQYFYVQWEIFKHEENIFKCEGCA